MVTFWLFCLAASALSSGRAAEEEEGEKAREERRRWGRFRLGDGADMEREIV